MGRRRDANALPWRVATARVFKPAPFERMAWQPPAVLGPNDIHVWSFKIHRVIESPLRFLSAQELERVRSLRTSEAQRAYAQCHAVVRCILGGYLGLRPECVPIRAAVCARCRSPHGKPFVAVQDRLLSFSLSHHRDAAVLAVALGCEVGIDIERWDSAARLELAAPWIGTSAELGLLGGPSQRLSSGVLELWVRKEAALKATGRGLTLDPNTFTLRASGDGAWSALIAGITVEIGDFEAIRGSFGALATIGRLPRHGAVTFVDAQDHTASCATG